ARRAGAPIRYLTLPGVELSDASGLLAFPAKSNFSGALHPLSLVNAAKARGLDVLLDVATYAGCRALSLRDCCADFAVLSFYKMFGYPTGVGALIARRDALEKLQRPWFAGGTVEYVSVKHEMHTMLNGYEAFEDGTPNFLSIAALPAAFA